MLNNPGDLPLGVGVIVTVPKPGKKPTVENRRPITLLNNLRKILSLVILERIRPAVEEYLGPSQSGFRRNRGTADAVWAHRFMISKAQKFYTRFHILGIDLSKAFDTVNRAKLLQTIKPLIDNDSYQMIERLMAGTTNMVRIEGELGSTFPSTIGVPQGDALSPILFVIYLQGALNELMEKLRTKHGLTQIYRIIYADDADFIVEEFIDPNNESTTIHSKDLEIVEQEAAQIFLRWNLKVNLSKTDRTTVDKSNVDWHTTKKLGSQLDCGTDIKTRKQKAEAAFNSLWRFWKKEYGLTVKTKVRLHNAFIKPVLLYNCATWAPTRTQMKGIESFNRRLLRRFLGVYFPNHISCAEVYNQSGTVLYHWEPPFGNNAGTCLEKYCE